MITVRDLLEQTLPDGTAVVGGAQSLDEEVSWVALPSPTPPAFSDLHGGELILLSAAELANLDEYASLERAVRELSAREVVAIAYAGRASGPARQAAEQTGLVLLQLAAATDLGPLEASIRTFITDQLRQNQRRGAEVGRRLMELALAGEPFDAILRAMSEQAHAAVVLENRDGRILGVRIPDEVALDRRTVEEMIGDGRDGIAGWLRASEGRSPLEPPVGSFPLSGPWQRAVAPAIGGEGLLGNVSLLIEERSPTAAERALASRAAAACAVVLGRDYAAVAARREIAGSLLDEILDGALRSELALRQAARRYHYDLDGEHIVLACRLESTGPKAVSRPRDQRWWQTVEEILDRPDGRLLWRFRNGAEVLWPASDPDKTAAAAKTLHEQLNARLGEPGSVVAVGVGGARCGVAGIRQSYQEAKQALTIGRRLNGTGRLTRFEELGVYRLIFAAEHLPELGAFHDEALGPLLAYDRAHNGELIRTLKGYFDANCGPKEAAALLGVHRNTVLYRLQRIQEITALDLDNPDVRLRLHLAACIHLALHSGEDGR